MSRNPLDIFVIESDHRVPAAIRASRTVHVLLNFTGQDLERPLIVMVGREVAAKVQILLRFRGSEPKYFSQVGNHASHHTPKAQGTQAAKDIVL